MGIKAISPGISFSRYWPMEVGLYEVRAREKVLASPDAAAIKQRIF